MSLRDEQTLIGLWRESLASELAQDHDPQATIPLRQGFAASGLGEPARPSPAVAADGAPEGALSQPTLPTPPPPGAAFGELALTPTRGSRRFDRGPEIARGGMGVVYEGRQGSLSRKVALKGLRAELRSADMERRFLAEARVTGRLEHPNIVPIHDLDRTPSGEPWLAMKLVRGLPWSELLHPRSEEARGCAEGMELEDHLEILRVVGNAIAYAHDEGVVHCDLKPENIMVGGYGEVLVMDWGLALSIEGRAADAPPADALSAPCGTPAYMAPELALGEGDRVGRWTDVYLLGAILYELLAGRPPHGGRTLIEVLLAATRSTPPSFLGEEPGELADICRRALSSAPEDRYGSVPELQSALRDAAAHRQSARIVRHADELLAAGRRSADGAGAGGRDRLYSVYGEAIAGYRQARVLWDDNERAERAEDAARLSYAELALDEGDLALASAQVSHLRGRLDEASALGARIQDAERQRSFAARRARTLRWAFVLSLSALFFGLMIGGALLKIEKDHAERAAALEVLAKNRAEAARQRADEEAVKARRLASELAIENTTSRRRLAESLASEARLYSAEQDWSTAAHRAVEAGRVFEQVGASSYPARLTLWRARVGGPEALFSHSVGRFGVGDIALLSRRGLLALGHGDGSLQLRKTPSLAPSGRSLFKHRGEVRALAVDRRETVLVSLGADGVVHGHSIESGQLTARVTVTQPKRGRVQRGTTPYRGPALSSVAATALAPLDDQRRLILGREDGSLELWDLLTKKRLRVLRRPRGARQEITDLERSHDGQTFAVGFANLGFGLLRQPFQRLEEYRSPGGARKLAFSPDDQRLIIAKRSGEVSLWSLAERAEQLRFTAHEGPVTALAFSADGGRLFSLGGDGFAMMPKLRSWSSETGRLLSSSGHSSALSALALDTAGGLLWSADVAGSVQAWALERPARGRPLDVGARDWGARLSADGRTVALSSRDRVALYDSDARQLLTERRFDQSAAHSDAFPLARGRLLLVRGELLTIEELASGEERTLLEASSVIEAALLDEDESSVICALRDGRLVEVGLTGGSSVTLRPPISERLTCASRGVDGSVLSGHVGGALRLWKRGESASERRFVGGPRSPELVGLSADQSFVFAASWRYGRLLLKRWRAADGAPLSELLELKGHSDYLQSLSLSRCRSVLISASLDGRLGFWSLESGRAFALLPLGIGPLKFVRSRPGHDDLVVCSASGLLRILDISGPLEAGASPLDGVLEALSERPQDAEARARLGAVLAAAGADGAALVELDAAARRRADCLDVEQHLALRDRLGMSSPLEAPSGRPEGALNRRARAARREARRAGLRLPAVTALALAPGGEEVAVAWREAGRPWLASVGLAEGPPRAPNAHHAWPIIALRYTQEGDLLSLDASGRALRRSSLTGVMRLVSEVAVTEGLTVAALSEGRDLFVAADRAAGLLTKRPGSKSWGRAPQARRRSHVLGLSSDGATLFTAFGTETLERRAVEGGARSRTLEFATEVTVVACAPTGDQIAVGERSGALSLLSSNGEGVPLSVSGHEARIERLCYGSLGRYGVSLDAEGQLLLWRAETGEVVAAARVEERGFVGLVWSGVKGRAVVADRRFGLRFVALEERR